MRSVTCIIIAAIFGFAMTVSFSPANALVGRGGIPISGQESTETSAIQKAQYYRYGYGGYYNGGNVAGAAIAGGILGLATGAIIAGSAASAAAPPLGVVNPDWIAYCARKYRSFDPASGTFLAHDGNRYYCR
jgi:hypothetical protein